MDFKELVQTLIRVGIVSPKKKLGQHFMVDEKLLHRLVDYAYISNEDIVLEIGAGIGLLTKLLSEKAKIVYAVELDRKLVNYLKSRFPDGSNVKIIEGDFLKIEIGGFNKVVSNPPYAISTPMILKLIKEKPDIIVLTLQEEFTRKLYAKPGDSEYGRLTVLTALNYDVEVMERIPREAFYPKSKIRSSVVRLKCKDHALDPIMFEAVKKIVTEAFTLRNKTLNGFVKRILPTGRPHYDSKIRVYQTPPEVFLEIAERFLRSQIDKNYCEHI
ncbi:ribosomal RNA small subunit methyltransferase A [Candidatus Bathyarchaeota archaeon]|nr:ribosomal RNA small subunit methyltransferase A [Candidatus Bathyarchaeota archaeon]MBS7613907.1 ribosomal RNA small subunit methyltransferase A [Candidatus Bathyarchaeota archaeon]